MAMPSIDPPSSPVTPLNLRLQPAESAESGFHTLGIEASLRVLGSNGSGLDPDDAAARLKKARHGEVRFGSARSVMLAGFKQKVSLLFLLASALSFVNGQAGQGMVILAAMLANAGIQGLIQWKSDQQGGLLEEADALRCSVRRGGRVMTIPASELVPGDILMLGSGHVLPADCRLLLTEQLQVDEALLTGESVLVPKDAHALHAPDEDVSARSNMVFAGTRIKTGKGEAVVTAVGDETVMGRIANLSRGTEKRESPFTRRLNVLGNRVFLGVFVLASLAIALEYTRGAAWPQLVMLGLILSIAAFPESIPRISSLILALGARRLAERQVLVKDFQALETIGDVTLVCSDKTGTLTENYLTFDQVYLPELGAIPYNPDWQRGDGIPARSVEEFLRIARLNNNTVDGGLRSALMGDPIDAALYRSAPASVEAGYHRRLHVPFDQETMRSATLCDAPGGRTVSFIKGAPEAVMETCTHFMRPDGSILPLSLAERVEFLRLNRKLAAENNLRVIGFAEKWLDNGDNSGPFGNAIFIGWVCLYDPPRPGVVDAIARLQQAGAKMVMITGDQKGTAEMTARELGMMSDHDEVWLRTELDAARENGYGIPRNVRVFARTKPEEKLAIVEALQAAGHIVAMVGDGVNDTPALQRSDVAIAMGRQGAEAAKDSADLILLNDRMDGILDAIRESRQLRGKVRATVQYLMTGNLGLVFFAVAAVIAGQGLSLNLVQLLWINLLMTLLPTLVLALEPLADDAAIPRRDATPDPLDHSETVALFVGGLLMAVAGLAAYLVPVMAFHVSPAMAGTLAFCTLASIQTLNLFSVKVARGQALRDLTTMPVSWIVLGLSVGLQLAAVYWGPLNAVLGTVALPPVCLVAPPVLALMVLGARLSGCRAC